MVGSDSGRLRAPPDLACKPVLLSADFLKNNKVIINVTNSTIFLDGTMGYMVYIGNYDY